jgi:hypothetical protein
MSDQEIQASERTSRGKRERALDERRIDERALTKLEQKGERK